MGVIHDRWAAYKKQQGGTSSPSAAGGIVSAELPAGVEFAFWGYRTGHVGALVAALRVTVAGNYSWGDEGDTSLVEGFDYADTAGDANLAAMQVGQYVVIFADRLSASDYAAKLVQWGFNPAAALPGAWQPATLQSAGNTLYDNSTSGLAAGAVQDAIDELTARIVALETP